MSAPVKTGLPTNKAVLDLLQGLLGRAVTVAPGAPVTPTPSRPTAFATYVDPGYGLNAVVLIDLPLAAWCAGALALLPKGGCEDAVEEGELSEMQVEVLHEVVNVAASLFNAGGVLHSKLDKLYAPGEAVPADLAVLTGSTNRLDLDVTVAGYGGGSLSIILN
ncbi:hypothetical protein SAMN05660199_00778 [Klenkia soli]|uniref:Chemotaxis phosphatase CheX n=1 Tax=Klenkia soli TaxID=1052260 RepID=A0A1H0EKJ5_9ACTN|nr:hypothetical protein [Klenkia soli]SDN82938.1 hypothetical protein SAMN05660199_00778 [Klenkia soli]